MSGSRRPYGQSWNYLVVPLVLIWENVKETVMAFLAGRFLTNNLPLPAKHGLEMTSVSQWLPD